MLDGDSWFYTEYFRHFPVSERDKALNRREPKGSKSLQKVFKIVAGRDTILHKCQ